MLTLTVVSDGSPADTQTAISLAYNSGLAVKVLGLDGKELGTVSASLAIPEPVEVDEPHPVLEREVAPEVAPEPTGEVTGEVVVSESSP
jgi:hypothetical protein